jgi:hypothetical protein
MTWHTIERDGCFIFLRTYVNVCSRGTYAPWWDTNPRTDLISEMLAKLLRFAAARANDIETEINFTYPRSIVFRSQWSKLNVRSIASSANKSFVLWITLFGNRTKCSKMILRSADILDSNWNFVQNHKKTVFPFWLLTHIKGLVI